MSVKKTGSVLEWLRKLWFQAAWKRLKKLIMEIVEKLGKTR